MTDVDLSEWAYCEGERDDYGICGDGVCGGTDGGRGGNLDRRMALAAGDTAGDFPVPERAAMIREHWLTGVVVAFGFASVVAAIAMAVHG